MDQHEAIASALKGRYDIEHELGQGGMAIVYLATDVRHRRHVALKVLRLELTNSIGAERFLREIGIAASLVHPNILALYDSGEAAGNLFYVMPHLEGPTLRTRLAREVQLPLDESVAIATEIASALDYAHERGIVHRDIKPDNVLFVEGHALVADFGLAKALTIASNVSLTEHGIAIGTPAYMSPEQCNATGVIDGRSDVYALACVVFEMIAGVPPFRGATAQSTIAHHLNTPPPSLCAERRTCPPGVDEVVRRALAKVPADRYKTAGEFAAALADAAKGGPVIAPKRGVVKRRWVAMAAGFVALVALPAWWAGGRASSSDGATIPADTTNIALLPLESAPEGGPQDDLLYEAFARWRDVTLMEPILVGDAVKRRGRIATAADARAVARALGAGRYVRGKLTPLGDSVGIRVALYDVSRETPLYQAMGRTGARSPAGELTDAYRKLADSLMLRGLSGDGPPERGGRRSIQALQAFAAAQRALDEWDLPSAETAFETVTRLDEQYARGQLWLAQARAWQKKPGAQFSEAARRAVAGAQELSVRDARLASALSALAADSFPRACAIYEALHQRNDRDFAAWFGSGQCRTLDKVVVPFAASPSGWRFRSSYGRGLLAFTKALVLLPSAHRALRGNGFISPRNLLLTERDNLVSGRSVGPDSARFLGRLGLQGDSILVVPYPWQDIAAGRALYPPGFDEALARQRAAFRDLATAWALALPRSESAKEALAISLELVGDPAAADTLRSARRLTSESARALQLASSEVLTRLKFALPNDVAALARARRLADSLLASDTSSSVTAAAALAPLAEITGRCAPAVTYARRAALPQTQPFVIPQFLSGDAAAATVSSALDCGKTEVDALLKRVRGHSAFEGRDTRDIAEFVLVHAAAQMTFPAEARAILALRGPGPLLRAMQQALRGDTSSARATLIEMRAQRGATHPWIEAAYPEAKVWLYLGDSTTALGVLRGSLGAIQSYAPGRLAAAGASGALIQSISLRISLERANGDSSETRKWAAAFSALRPTRNEAQTAVRAPRRPQPAS